MCGVSLRGRWWWDSQGGGRWWRRGWRRNWGGGGGRIFAYCCYGEGGRKIQKITMYLVVLLKLRILEARQLSVPFAT